MRVFVFAYVFVWYFCVRVCLFCRCVEECPLNRGAHTHPQGSAYGSHFKSFHSSSGGVGDADGLPSKLTRPKRTGHFSTGSPSLVASPIRFAGMLEEEAKARGHSVTPAPRINTRLDGYSTPPRHSPSEGMQSRTRSLSAQRWPASGSEVASPRSVSTPNSPALGPAMPPILVPPFSDVKTGGFGNTPYDSPQVCSHVWPVVAMVLCCAAGALLFSVSPCVYACPPSA